jgi:hypothetical protein
VIDWTNPKKVKELAWFDRGPIDPTRLVLGGFWSSYFYNARSTARRSSAASTSSTSRASRVPTSSTTTR